MQYCIYLKLGDGNSTNTNKSGGGNDDDAIADQNGSEPNADTPTGTAGVHVEPNGTPGNDQNNDDDNKEPDDDNDEQNQNNGQRSGGMGGVHLTNIAGHNESINYTISEILGTHPINHPIFNTQNEDDSSGSDEALAGMYQFYAEENDSLNEESKHKTSDGLTDVPSQISGEQTSDLKLVNETSDKNTEINSDERNDNFNKEEFCKYNNTTDNEESDCTDEDNDDDRLYMFCNDGDDCESLHDYLGENNYNLDESDEEYLEETGNSEEGGKLHGTMNHKDEEKAKYATNLIRSSMQLP